MVINTAELFKRLAENMGIGKGDCKLLMRILANTICEILKEGDVIKWRGILEFGVRYRGESTVIHPVTGERINCPAKFIPYCNPGKIIQDAVNEGRKDPEAKESEDKE